MRFPLGITFRTGVVLLAGSVSAAASPVVLTFDGLGGNLAQFYNGGLGSGGSGPNYGIVFLSGQLGNPCFQSLLSPLSCLPDPPAFIPGGESICPVPTPVNCTTMNVLGGFTNELRFQYIAPLQSMIVAIYSEVGGGGALLASASVLMTVDLNSNFTPGGYWETALPFAGTARSAQFVQNDAGYPGAFDNIVVDRVDAVPEPATVGSLAAGLLALALRRRRRK